MNDGDITDRQKKLLNAIIKEFIDTAEAVGSINLLDKYNFKVSSATIRNEMAELVFRGYLYKKHSSAGRIPTHKGWRFFVDDIKQGQINFIDATMQDQMLSNLVKLGNETDSLIRQSLNFLSMLSENATVALVGSNLYYSGLSNLPNIPELKQEENLQNILKILEDYYTLSEVFNSKLTNPNEVNILIGEEDTGKKVFEDYSVIFSEIKFKDGRGFVAVIGPNRMDYSKIISSVQYISDTIRLIVNRS